jgi:drug/metabolite transporter (DMT)-like permease
MPGGRLLAAEARRGRVAVATAAVAWSTAGLGQRSLGVDAPTQVAGRALFAFLTLLVIVVVSHRGRAVAAFRSMGRWDVLFAVLMAIASGTFILALNHTTVANVVFMQAAAPMLAGLLGWLLLGDVVTRRTWAAVAVAIVGVGVMAGASVGTGPEATLLPLLMTTAFAGNVVIARHRREVSMLPATCLSQALVVLALAPFVTPQAAGGGDWAILVALGIGQMGLALALFTVGARLLPPAEVALIALLEVVLSPIWVWLAYAERPAPATLLGGAVVLVAVAIQATAPAARTPPRGDDVLDAPDLVDTVSPLPAEGTP